MSLVKEGMKFSLFLLIIIAVTVLVKITNLSTLIDSQRILVFVQGLGIMGMIVFIIIASIASAFSVPLSLFIFLGAILFGVWKGTIVNTLAAIGGAMGGFWLAKYLGSGFVEHITRKHLGKFRQNIKKWGFTLVLLWRVTIVVPFPVVNYAAGLSKMRTQDYFFATILGLIPTTFILTYLFGKIGEQVFNENTHVQQLLTVPFISACVVLVLIMVIPIVYHAKKIRNSSIELPEKEEIK